MPPELEMIWELKILWVSQTRQPEHAFAAIFLAESLLEPRHPERALCAKDLPLIGTASFLYLQVPATSGRFLATLGMTRVVPTTVVIKAYLGGC